jgi:hypothetical protein
VDQANRAVGRFLPPNGLTILDELRQTDFRMSDRVYQDVLSKAGEA